MDITLVIIINIPSFEPAKVGVGIVFQWVKNGFTID